MQQNFNFGFSSYKSEMLVHLSQWQYWWWFWFGMWWALYYFMMLKVMTKKTFNFNVTLNTSVSGSGKWGDFLVALMPVSWCCNILINSNFMLSMIEWQNESSLFTMSMQGKQWYWVYKYDPSTFQNIITAPKNMGHDSWSISSGQDSMNADTYYQAINLTAQLEFQDSYTSFLKKNDLSKSAVESEILTSEPVLSQSIWSSAKSTALKLEFQEDESPLNLGELAMNTPKVKLKLSPSLPVKFNYSMACDPNLFADILTLGTLHDLSYLTTKTREDLSYPLNSLHYSNYYDYSQLDDTTDITSNLSGNMSTQPFSIVSGVLNNQVLDSLKNPNSVISPLFLNCTFSNGGEFMADKELHTENFWGFSQKKYKRMKKFAFKKEVVYDPVTFKVSGLKEVPNHSFIDVAGVDLLSADKHNSKFPISLEDNASVPQLPDSSSLITDLATTNYSTAVRLNSHSSELVPVTLASSLLSTKRTLVIPAHVNLTVITNSYDVVHSWFVPGLGLKMDCVPGSSTHHTFYVDNIGFYYGQCAEMCGRYHHHMPMSLCALPFEQFVVWWNSKGLSRMNRYTSTKTLSNPLTSEKLILKQS